MTEEEAREKWCPFARRPLEDTDGQVVVGTPVINRRASGAADNGCLCIASACMAWRWKADLNPDPNPESPLMVISATDGFCGLAGAPQ